MAASSWTVVEPRPADPVAEVRAAFA